MTTVTFETSTLADAVRKAAMIAPTKGVAFDSSAGILLEIRGSDPVHPITIKATNGEVFYLEWVDALDISGQDTVWRIPSSLFSQLLTMLPMGSNSSVQLKRSEQGRMELTCGKTRSELATMDPSTFPEFWPFDGSELATVKGLAARIQQISWACDKGQVPRTGIHIDGAALYATDLYRMATVPCVVPVTEPLTIPLATVSTLLKENMDAAIGVFDNKFYMMPDESTQIVASCYAEAFPNVKATTQKWSFNESVEVSAKQLVETINRMSIIAKSSRMPRLDFTIGDERLYLAVSDLNNGFIEDEIELTGQAVHPDLGLYFTPQNLTQALDNSPNDKLTLHYNTSTTKQPVYIDGGSGYQAWVMPRVKSQQEN